MRWIRSYIKYLANEKKEIQRIHAVFIAAILTAVFTGAYLYILYDIAPPTPDISISNKKVYVRDQNSNTSYVSNNMETNSDTVAIPPENSIYKIADILENIGYRFSELKGFLQTSNTYTATSTNEN